MAESDPGRALTGDEGALAEQEAIIARGLHTFYEVGTALLTIRDNKLYDKKHQTFEAYCWRRWGLKQSRAYQFIDSAQVVGQLKSSTTVELPANEAQVRPLAALPAERQTAVWQEAVATAPNGKVTGVHVAATIERLANPLAVHFSSETPEWYTPPKIIAAVVEFFDAIDLDPCADPGYPKTVPARQHYTREDNGLARPWWGRVYMNPPYGDEIGQWVERLVTLDRAGTIEAGIALLPARTGTQWWKLLGECAICFIDGRLTFVGATSTAPFPSVLAYTGDEWERFRTVVGHLGDVWRRMP